MIIRKAMTRLLKRSSADKPTGEHIHMARGERNTRTHTHTHTKKTARKSRFGQTRTSCDTKAGQRGPLPEFFFISFTELL